MKNCVGDTEPARGCARRRRIQRLLRRYLLETFEGAPNEVLWVFENNPAELQRQITRIITKTEKKLPPVAAVLEKIQLHWKGPIYLSELAGELHMSATALGLQFKLLTGRKFVDATNEPRLRRAKQLLQRSRLSLKTIASEAGFTESRNLVEAFRKRHGCTPSQFREQLAMRGNAP